MVGVGSYARHRLHKLLELPEAQVVALCDPDPNQIEAAIRLHPKIADLPAYADAKAMVANEELEALQIATPHTQHAEQMLLAFESGLHAIVEKPMVTRVRDAHMLIEARERAKRIGMVSYQRHFQPEFRYVRRQIAQGQFGKVQFVQALLGQEWKNMTRGSWRQHPALSGGGQLCDSGSHLVDALLWTTGLTADTVTAFIDRRGTAVDINSNVAIRFKEEALGAITIVGDAPHWYEEITFFCDDGAFYIRNGRLSVSDSHGNRSTFDHLSGGGTPDRNFIDAILGRAECESPLECGLRVIELTEAAYRSAEQGGAPVHVSAL